MPLPESNPDINSLLNRIATALERIAANMDAMPPMEHLTKTKRELLPTANPKKTKSSMGYKRS